MEIIRLDSCPSTNAALDAMPDAAEGTVVVCRRQTAGRGQRGNSWEAEPGRNLTFSMLLRPAGLPAARQFMLSMAVAVAIADAVDYVFEQTGVPERAAIKWPNDIYVGDKKICGILIENKLAGADIHRSVIGVGLNVNQHVFCSDAPNPVSIIHITGSEYPLDVLLADLVERLADYRSALADPDALSRRYMARMYRNDGREHPFIEPDGTQFTARITGVAPDGMLSLSNGRSYAFKEIIWPLA